MKRGVGCSMVRKSGVGRAWEVSKWFPRVLWECFGRPKMTHEKGVACFMVPKNRVGRAWDTKNEA